MKTPRQMVMNFRKNWWLGEWLTNWMLILNLGKYTILYIDSPNPARQYTLNSTVVRRLKEQLDFEVTITENFKWESHLNKIL